jgi:hypothetical protein
MTYTSKAARKARRSQRRGFIKAGRHEARAMILAGAFDAMPSTERAVRRSERMRDR